MAEAQQKKRRQLRLARLEIVAQMYKRGNSVRKIQAEVMARLDLKSYSLSVVDRDIKELLDEWREHRLDDVDLALQLELERIDDTVRELWSQWEKSKQDFTKTASKRKGAPTKDAKTGNNTLQTYQKEETETEVVQCGNPTYISEIRQQLAERRKLLGLYAPEQKEFKIQEYDLKNLSPEQRAALLEIGEQVLNEKK